MTSEFTIPIKLLNTSSTPSIPRSGFQKLYFKNTWLTSLDTNGVEKDVVLSRVLTGFTIPSAANLKMKRKYQLMNDIGHGHISGKIYIDCSAGDVDIDVRARHDNGDSVDFTAVNGKLGVHKIGEY